MVIAIIPRWILRYLSADSLNQYNINVLISNILLILTFLIFKNSMIEFLNILPHFCLFDKLFGVECPLCGTTRAFSSIANADLIQAYNLNIASFIVAAFFLMQIPLRVISVIRNQLTPNINRISKYAEYIVWFAILANWFYALLA